MEHYGIYCALLLLVAYSNIGLYIADSYLMQGRLMCRWALLWPVLMTSREDDASRGWRWAINLCRKSDQATAKAIINAALPGGIRKRYALMAIERYVAWEKRRHSVHG